MGCDKLIFWPDYCEHLGIEKKTPTTSKKGVAEIALVSSLSEPVKDQEKALVQKSEKIILESISK